MGAGDFERYLLQEWELFAAHPERAAVAAEIRRHIAPVGLVADIGCGAGQELLPHLGDAMCVGVDIAAEGLTLARERLAQAGASRLGFARARAEALPMRTATVDLVICRLALMYTHVPSALNEVARVLRPGGGFSAQIHGPRYYLRMLRKAANDRNGPRTRYALRVMRTGIVLHVTGQHREVLGTLETFLTIARFRAMAAARGLSLVARLENRNPHAPHLLFRRQ